MIEEGMIEVEEAVVDIEEEMIGKYMDIELYGVAKQQHEQV